VSPRIPGLSIAALCLIADQAHKLWMLFVYDIAARQPVHVAPFLDLVMAWNPGISYSLFAAETETGRWTLLGVTLLATSALGIWLWRAPDRLSASALGLIVGGALGNAYDRYAYGAVADFFYFFLETEMFGRLSWYVFNIADVAIVAGVALLLYESFLPSRANREGIAGPDKVKA
jgi:signal peptidase II